MAVGEGLAGVQAPKPLVMTRASPIDVGCLDIAQAAGLRAGQQEHVSLGVKWRGKRKKIALQVGVWQEESKWEGSPSPE